MAASYENALLDTAAGIVMDAPPPAYAALWNDETERDWDKLLAKHGYERKGAIGGEFGLIDVTIWRHQDGQAPLA